MRCGYLFQESGNCSGNVSIRGWISRREKRSMREDLFEKYVCRRLSAEEAVQLAELLDGDPDARKEFLDFVEEWTLVATLSAAQLKLGLDDKVLKMPAKVESKGWWRYAAAVAACLAAVAGCWWLAQGGRNTAGHPGDVSAVAVVAKAEQCSGVSVEVSGDNKRQLKAGDELREGMRIETGRDGMLKLAYVGEATILELTGGSALEFVDSTSCVLHAGRVNATVANRAGKKPPFAIATPQARATVLGTKISLRTDNQASRLDVREGVVEFARLSDGASVKVAAGQLALAGGQYALKAYPAGTKYVDADVLFRDDFSNGLGNWLISGDGGKDVEDGAGNTGDRADARYREKKVEVRIVDVPGVSGKCVKMRKEASVGYTTLALTLKKSLLAKEYYSVDADVMLDGAASGTGGFIITHDNVAAAKWVRVAGGTVPTRGVREWIHARAEVVTTTDENGVRCVEISNFYDGKLIGRKRGTGSDVGELVVDAFVNGQTILYLRNVVARQMVPLAE
ncbi:MAG: hypothetical protein C0404_01880 [Verrucomicrobia bacterium]|nr:hypothetical protein [Verrucomicrobiota bacterium]